MGISPHVARLRAAIGHELLVLPCVTVLPIDEQGRILLAWHTGHTDGTPSPGDGELSKVAWFTRAELQVLQLSRFTQALLTATGHLRPQR